MKRTSTSSDEDEYLGQHHVYEPHRVGLPKFRPYFRELWGRRAFAFEMAHTSMRAANTDTALGQAWLVLNPLLLSLVYYLLLTVLKEGGASKVVRGTHTVAAHASTAASPSGWQLLAHITGGLFVFYFITGAMASGASSVTQGGRLILNTPFPKMLLTLSTVYQALRRFLPTMLVYAAIHLLAGRPINVSLLWLVPILFLATLFATGVANLLATAQVYFRDVASFLPYFIRIWLYISPVLLTIASIRRKFHGLQYANPLYSLLGSWTTVLDEGKMPPPTLMLQAAFWAFGALVVGSLIFMSREREFAVRIA